MLQSLQKVGFGITDLWEEGSFQDGPCSEILENPVVWKKENPTNSLEIPENVSQSRDLFRSGQDLQFGPFFGGSAQNEQ